MPINALILVVALWSAAWSLFVSWAMYKQGHKYRILLRECQYTIEQLYLLMKDSEQRRLSAEAERESWKDRATYLERLSTSQPETRQ